MVSNNTKGKILEDLVQLYMEEQGYETISAQQNYPGIGTTQGGEMTLEGRGTSHQIDALGQFDYNIPFVYQLRLLTEAKCKKDTIGPRIIREHIGVLKDISENYFVESSTNLRDKTKQRFTDVAAIFSTSRFTEKAQELAYAQGIYLVPVPTLKKHVKHIASKIDNQGISREKALQQYLDEEELYIYFGLASDTYPLTITSDEPIPENAFQQSDRQEVTIHYEENEAEEEIEYFTVNFNGWEGRFQLPEYLWEEYSASLEFREEMLETKQENLNKIDIPIKFRQGIRRLITLQLDRSWLETERFSIEKQREKLYERTAVWHVIETAETEHDTLYLGKDGLFAPFLPEEAEVLVDHPDYSEEIIDRLLDLEQGDKIEMALALDNRPVQPYTPFDGKQCYKVLKIFEE